MTIAEKPVFAEGLPVHEHPIPTIIMAAGECHGFKALLDRVQIEMMAVSDWETASQITIMASEVGIMEATLNEIIRNHRSKVKLENQ